MTFTAIDTKPLYSNRAPQRRPPIGAMPQIDSAESEEHIVIDGDGPNGPASPKTVDDRLRLSNRPRGQATEVTFYAEGYVNVRIEDSRKEAV